MGIIDGLIGTVTSLPSNLTGGFLGEFFNRRAVKYQNSLQQRNARYWAEYNSPVNQMARLREAGLNPALVYGNGSVANTFNGTTPVGSYNFKPTITDGLSSSLAVQQIKNMKKQNDLLDSQKKSVDEDITGKKLDNQRKLASDPTKMGENDLQSIINDNNLKLSQITKTQNDAENSRLQQGIQKTQQQLYDLELDFKSTYGRGQEYLKLLNSAAALRYAELQNDTYLDRWLLEQDYKRAEIKQIKATVSNLYALGSLYKSQKDKTDFETDGLKIKNAILELERILKLYSLPAEVIDKYLSPVLDVIKPFSGKVSSSKIYERGFPINY